MYHLTLFNELTCTPKQDIPELILIEGDFYGIN